MDDQLVAVDIEGIRALVSVGVATDSIEHDAVRDSEHEVGPRTALDLSSAFAASAGAARMALEAISDLEWQEAKISLGIEFALESGTLVAVFGKATAKSTIAVELGFQRAGRASE